MNKIITFYVKMLAIFIKASYVYKGMLTIHFGLFYNFSVYIEKT